MKFADQMKLGVHSFDDLENEMLFQILKLRSEVFVIEQQCMYQDLDKEDREALHITLQSEQKVIAYCRLFETSDAWKLGRIIVDQSYRTHGLGQRVVKYAVDHCSSSAGNKNLIMSAQVYLTDYYAKFGFEVQGNMYLEDGIPHIKSVYQNALINVVE